MQEEESMLGFYETERGIKFVKDKFERKLAEKLHLLRVTAPRFLVAGTGLQDDLAGTQVPVRFKTKAHAEDIEVVHSLAKWKRYTLGKYDFKIGTGLYTDMDAIRKDEELDETHSIYVDQWDWELVITKEDRTIDFLKKIVEKIFDAMKKTEKDVEKEFPVLPCRLPEKITFIHSEELEKMYPCLKPKEREDAIAKKHGAVFLIGIGYPLESGKPHDIRAADYDDWSTETEKGIGLNGDIIVWDSVGEKSLELSSMGIRVGKKALLTQLKLMQCEEKAKLQFHKAIIEERLPLTIGGGIGQSRMCMFLLRKKHIGEVHSSVWSKEIHEECRKKGVCLL